MKRQLTRNRRENGRTTFPTSLSIELELWQRAVAKAAANRQSFSGYLKSLIDRDLASDGQHGAPRKRKLTSNGNGKSV